MKYASDFDCPEQLRQVAGTAFERGVKLREKCVGRQQNFARSRIPRHIAEARWLLQGTATRTGSEACWRERDGSGDPPQ
ncbi:hypothetical protein [Falsiroseomonas sp. HW251]|uniref:hypothetical protein n=1 Tax=Falsiroseomonas sp. HW251 TaxID=3390998 RepID=UPI003D313EE5